MGINSVEPSDAELVRRVRTGDTGAYGALVSRYRDRLGRYAVHMIGDREDAEEALQDSFVRAYRSLARCDDPARFGAWLYGILVNRCRTTRRPWTGPRMPTGPTAWIGPTQSTGLSRASPPTTARRFSSST